MLCSRRQSACHQRCSGRQGNARAGFEYRRHNSHVSGAQLSLTDARQVATSCATSREMRGHVFWQGCFGLDMPTDTKDVRDMHASRGIRDMTDAVLLALMTGTVSGTCECGATLRPHRASRRHSCKACGAALDAALRANGMSGRGQIAALAPARLYAAW